MSKIESFDRNTCKLMRLELDKALEDVANKFGIKIHTGGASFSDNTVTFKVELATVGTNGVASSKEGEAFKMYATMLGMKPESPARMLPATSRTLSRHCDVQRLHYSTLSIEARMRRFILACSTDMP